MTIKTKYNSVTTMFKIYYHNVGKIIKKENNYYKSTRKDKPPYGKH